MIFTSVRRSDGQERVISGNSGRPAGVNRLTDLFNREWAAIGGRYGRVSGSIRCRH